MEALVNLFNNLSLPDLVPRYNIAPTQQILCVRENEGDLQAASLRWGLIPFWAKDLSVGARMINARSETVATKPSFRAAFKRRRCLILADGFYEWKKDGPRKQPYFIQINEQPFCMAGLWESWRDKTINDPKSVETCTILTTTANQMMEPLHERMPVILSPDQYPVWLDSQFSEIEPLESLLKPFPPETMTATAVSTFVNKPVNDSPECIRNI